MDEFLAGQIRSASALGFTTARRFWCHHQGPRARPARIGTDTDTALTGFAGDGRARFAPAPYAVAYLGPAG